MFDPVSTEPSRAVSDQLGNLNPRTYNTISPIAEALTDGTYTLNSVPRAQWEDNLSRCKSTAEPTSTEPLA